MQHLLSSFGANVNKTIDVSTLRLIFSFLRIIFDINFFFFLRSLRKQVNLLPKNASFLFVSSLQSSLLSVLNIGKFIAKCPVTSNTEKVVPPSVKCPVKSNAGKICVNSFQKWLLVIVLKNSCSKHFQKFCCETYLTVFFFIKVALLQIRLLLRFCFNFFKFLHKTAKKTGKTFKNSHLSFQSIFLKCYNLNDLSSFSIYR